MPGIDIIGDIHGQLGALQRLGARLGYAVDRKWAHPDGRRLLFVGDLIDRGPSSLEVSLLVRDRCATGEHLCLLGNHEMNLIEWRRGRTGPKSSNRPTIAAVEANPTEWGPVLDFFESLPVAVELEDLRVIHAVWHRRAVEAVRGKLGMPSVQHPVSAIWSEAVALHAAYEGGRLRPGLSQADFEDQTDSALAVLVKGYESRVQDEFRDNDGALRDRVRTEWWKPEYTEVPTDKRTVFGHYWNMPPVSNRHDAFVPPHPSGHPDLRAWFNAHHAAVPDEGTVSVPQDVGAVCVDYNGITRVGHRACVGAYRHPEAEVVWATTST